MEIERILLIAAASLVIVATAGGALVGADDEPSEKTVGGRGLKAVAKENRYALIIGVDYFPNLPTKEANERAVERGAERPSDDYALTSCANDAKNLAAALVEYAGFEADNVDALTFRKGDELEPSDPNVPTAANIRRKIAELTETLSEDDMLLVAFSGHGVAFGVKSNDDPVKRSYLCGCDADLSALSTFVDRKELLETLEKCRARRKIFLADCCRDAFALRTGGRFRGVRRSVASSANPFESGEYGFAQISACREGQRALETTDGGLFTSALIDGLRRGANEAGELSLTAWFEYAEKQTTARSRAILTTTPELGALDKAGRRQTVQSPTLYLIGETPRWIFADGLPVDGAALETWAKADALFDAARKIRERLQVGTSRPSDGAESERVAE